MLLWLFWLPFMVLANEANENNGDQYIEVGQWQVSLAVGVGVKANPLVDGDNIPLVLVPDVAYYGESFYFDNGDLGYTWLDEPNWSVSTVLRLNTERAYFSFWHPANILLSPVSANGATGGEDTGSTDNTSPGQGGLVLSIDEVANRKFALDAGVQALWHFDSGGRLSLAWFNDMSGVYKGHWGTASYAQGFKVGAVKWLASIGFNYKSADLIDYYYGIDDRDKVTTLFHYQGKKSISPVLKLDMRYPLNDDWQFISFLRYESLGDGMKNSPLVRKDYTATGFVGVSYDF